MPTRSTSGQHIIGLGASAGGIEAIFDFFDHTPLDDVSYVVIQHLSPNHQSRLAELLARHSKLAVCLAEDQMRVEPNKVYVIHHQVYMTIEAGKLRLSAKTEQKAPHRTINAFFRSLAADQAEKAIGVILSGTGTDGAEGVAAVKKAGGFVLVQDPATATYADMPAHALATGCADEVLSPQAMPGAIQHHVHGRAAGPAAAGDEPTLEAIIELLRSQLPFDFSEYKRPTIFRRIRKRMAHHQLDHPEAYLAFLDRHPEELQALAQDFLISVTSFFRDPAAFELLEKKVIPVLLAGPGAGPVKLWVAGCATGQEAYSLAILVIEYLARTGTSREVKLFATDLDKAALAVASKGIYPAGIAREVSTDRLERFFTREGENYRVSQEIRKLLVFAQHDLGKHPPYCHLDLITCRNLLIYLNPSLQQKIFAQLHFGLRPDGYLMLGPSENASVLQPYVEEISRKWKVYRKTLDAPLPRFESFSLPFPPPRVDRSPTTVRPPEPRFAPQPAESLNEALLQESGQAGVCVDENLQVVQAFGAVDGYLLPKVLTFGLTELLPGPLAVAFGAAAHRALQKGERVVITGIALPGSDPARSVQLLVRPLSGGKHQAPLLLVLFREETPALGLSGPTTSFPGEEPAGKGLAEPFDASRYHQEYLVRLEEERKDLREQLHAAREKQEATEENLLSFNEELLSANEEMQSANEELQSVNEELQSVNSEYQLKIRELTQLNDDLNNYFRSNQNGTVFFDKELRVKKFSPAAVQHINLRDSDVGRPLHHLTTNIRFETLAADILQVVTSGQAVTREVQANTGRYYQVTTVPYIRQSDGQLDGAILTFYDVTHMKQTQEELQASNQSLLRIKADLENFVYSASHDLLSPLSNVEGLIHLLQDNTEATSPENQQYYQMIQDALARFRSMVRELADIGKLQAGMVGDQDVVNWRELLEEIRLSMLDQVTATRAVIKADFVVPQITLSRKNLRSILYNLVNNALKYRSPQRDPEITIRTEVLPGLQRLTVQDNGMGMASDKLPTIFTLYQRLGEQQVEGQGIGLYLVRKLMDAAGGTIEVESTPGEGTTFTLYFKTSQLQ